ncbi:hypothetical protein ACJJH9_20645 [Microbulbifer sp. DLAB2-AF]|uniref:hypothetical protein n=1 Tax=Microbulbifer sp. DLAB2-AF TaxID=3243395 RepID=UPI0040391D46
MLAPNIDNYVRNLVRPELIQTSCRPPKTIREYATDFQRNSRCSWKYSRSKDGLTRIDQLVTQAALIQTLDYTRISNTSQSLIEAMYTWLTGFNPSNPVQQLTSDGIQRRQNAITTLLGGAYCWYRQASEAALSEPLALGNIQNHNDIPFNLYRYRFSRSGFNLHMTPGRLYRGDTRPPQMLWQSGGFFPKMDNNNRHDPHLGSGASCQVISSTDDPNVVARFAWHNKTYCPVRYYYLHQTDRVDKAIAGFVYEFDKTGHECVEVANVTPGREVAFLAIPNQYIRRFRMRYYAGSQNNIVLSDWMYYNENSVRNIRITADKQRWESFKKNWQLYV